MAGEPHSLQVCVGRGAAEEPLGFRQGDAEFGVGLAGGDLGVATCAHIGINPDGDGGSPVQPRGDLTKPFEL